MTSRSKPCCPVCHTESFTLRFGDDADSCYFEPGMGLEVVEVDRLIFNGGVVVKRVPPKLVDFNVEDIAKNGGRYPKPKGKKKTFISWSVQMGASQWTPTSCALSKAWDYACVNPGSILEIVVRKPTRGQE